MNIIAGFIFIFQKNLLENLPKKLKMNEYTRQGHNLRFFSIGSFL